MKGIYKGIRACSETMLEAASLEDDAANAR